MFCTACVSFVTIRAVVDYIISFQKEKRCYAERKESIRSIEKREIV